MLHFLAEHWPWLGLAYLTVVACVLAACRAARLADEALERGAVEWRARARRSGRTSDGSGHRHASRSRGPALRATRPAPNERSPSHGARGAAPRTKPR